jgi:hypothetical protein
MHTKLTDSQVNWKEMYELDKAAGENDECTTLPPNFYTRLYHDLTEVIIGTDFLLFLESIFIFYEMRLNFRDF